MIRRDDAGCSAAVSLPLPLLLPAAFLCVLCVCAPAPTFVPLHSLLAPAPSLFPRCMPTRTCFTEVRRVRHKHYGIGHRAKKSQLSFLRICAYDASRAGFDSGTLHLANKYLCTFSRPTGLTQ